MATESLFQNLPYLALLNIANNCVSPHVICAVSKDNYANGVTILHEYNYIPLILDAIQNYVTHYKENVHQRYSKKYFRLVFSRKLYNEKQKEDLRHEIVKMIENIPSKTLTVSCVKDMFSLFEFKFSSLAIDEILEIIKTKEKILSYSILRLFDIDLSKANPHVDWFEVNNFEIYAPLLELFIKAKNNPHPLVCKHSCTREIITSGNLNSWNVLFINGIIKEADHPYVIDLFINSTSPKCRSLFVSVFSILSNQAKNHNDKFLLLRKMVECKSKLLKYYDEVFSQEDFEKFRSDKNFLRALTLTSIARYDPKVYTYLKNHCLIDLFYNINAIETVIKHNQPLEIAEIILSEPQNCKNFCAFNSETLSLAITERRSDIVRLLLEKTDSVPVFRGIYSPLGLAKKLKKERPNDEKTAEILKIIQDEIKKRKKEEENSKKSAKRHKKQ